MSRFILLLSAFFLLAFTQKDEDYFRKHIIEANSLVKARCHENIKATDPNEVASKNAECSAAESVVKEHSDNKQINDEYKKYFTSNIEEAKKFASSCEIKEESSADDKIKCKVALQILEEYFQKYKNKVKKERFKDNFRANIESAKKFMEAGCVGNEVQCEAAEEVLAEDGYLKARDILIDELTKISEKQISIDQLSNKDRAIFKNYEKYFLTNKNEAEEVVTICVKEKNNTKKSMECVAAIKAVLYTLKNQKEIEIKNNQLESKEAAQSQNNLSKSPEEIYGLVNGRCKGLLSDPWYKLDPELEDKECNDAIAANNINISLAQESKNTTQKKLSKNRTYFLNNIQEAEATAKQCKAGKIEDISECEFSISVVNEKEIEENNRLKYVAYYKKHQLAAKFFMKWCKSSMINFDIKCQAAENAIKNNEGKKQKIYSEELLAKDINKLKGDLGRVKEILNGKCKQLMEDSWYYLDENIRSEECDAAAEIARMAMEQKDKKQEADKKEGDNKINDE